MPKAVLVSANLQNSEQRQLRGIIAYRRFSRGVIVEKLVDYMAFKTYYETIGAKEDIPIKEFIDRIPPEIVLDLYVVYRSP